MEKIKQYLLKKDNKVEYLYNIILEINSYDGSLDYLDYQYNEEEFFNIMFSNSFEAVRATYYGDYNYMDEYVKLNVYGNLESVNEYELDALYIEYIDEITDRLIKLYKNNNIDIYDNQLKKLLDNMR